MALLSAPYTPERMLTLGREILASEARASGPNYTLEAELSHMTVAEVRAVQLAATRAREEADAVRHKAHSEANRITEACVNVLNGSRP